MNSSKQHHDSVADEQAALWAARLDGDTLDRAQRAELDAWLAEKPAHRVLLSQYCQFSADLEEQVPALVSAGAVTMPPMATATRRRFNFPLFAGIALAAAAAVVVTLSVFRPAPQIQHFAKASAQRGMEILADGTRVELNANTSLKFENTKTERRVVLAGGEALFFVAKDPSRPFFVQTLAGTVRVTGTTFNVRTERSAKGFEVTVVEGSVEVHPDTAPGVTSSSPVLLGAGDQYSSRKGRKVKLASSEVEDALAWRKGIIVFYDAPLGEALVRVAQYHGCAINVTPEAANVNLGGRYGIDDLKGFLADLESALPEVKVHDDKPSGAVTVSLRPGS
jgi:transmembrane sensor